MENNRYTAQGTIKSIGEVKQFSGGFSKREFVVTIPGKFSGEMCFELFKEKAILIDGFNVGDEIIVHFDIRCNEHNGKYYTNLSAWSLGPPDKQQDKLQPAGEADTDLPF